MYRATRKNNKDTNGYYIVQWRSEPYIFKDDKDMKGCEPSIKAYAGEIVWDTFFYIQCIMQHIGIHLWLK